MENIKERVAEIIGEASMCWSEKPKGVFNSEKASELVEEIMAHIEYPILDEPQVKPMTNKTPCHLGHTYDPTCIGCEAVNENRAKSKVETNEIVFAVDEEGFITTLSEPQVEKGWEEEFYKNHVSVDPENGQPWLIGDYNATIRSLLSSERERVVKEVMQYMKRCLLWSKGNVEGTRNDLIAKVGKKFNITLSESEEGKE